MTRLARALRANLVHGALVGALVAVAAAHVGSPDAFLVGKAGPYDVSIIVRPPQVVPGLAEVIVRIPASEAGDVRRVLVRPIFWRTGRAGSPRADEATRITAPEPTFVGKLWLMSSGAYTVDVEVDGARGRGTVSVPVEAVATAQLALSPLLKDLLVILGFILVFGMLTIVHAATGEALVAPGATPDPARRRASRVATAIAVPTLSLLLFGGWRWWNGEAAAYRRRLDRPLAVAASVASSGAGTRLRVEVTDTTWTRRHLPPLIPDHGKMMHLFLVRWPALDAFAHLHPAMIDRNTFEMTLPALPAGSYRVYADVVHESGYERTLVSSVRLASPATRPASAAADSDDAVDASGAAAAVARDGSTTGGGIAVARLPDGSGLTLGTDAWPIAAGQPVMLHFALVDAAGRPAAIDPYLGMAAHAVVLRRDGSVFAHLHPMGTIAPAAQRAFALREAGDTTPDGRLADSLARAGAMAPMQGMGAPDGRVALPYVFPRAGSYRLWLQVRHAGAIRTAAYDLDVR